MNGIEKLTWQNQQEEFYEYLYAAQFMEAVMMFNCWLYLV